MTKKDVDVIKVEKIVVNIKGNQIELSLEEARQLRNSLNEVVGNNWTITYPTVPYEPTYPDTIPWTPTAPWYTYTFVDPIYNPDAPICIYNM